MSSERLHPPPHPPPDDSELDDFLAGCSPISAAYREASRGEHAPPELDAAVMAAARAAPAARTGARRPRWLPFAAAAASLVLGVSVLTEVWRTPEAQVTFETAGRSRPAAPAPESGAVTLPQSVVIERASEQAAIVPTQRMELDKARAKAEQARREAELKSLAESKALEESRQRLRDERVGRQRFEREPREAAALADVQPAPAAAPAAPRAEAESASAMRKSAAADAASAVAPLERITSAVPDSQRGSSESPEAPPPPPALAAQLDAYESPEGWLARIRELLRREDIEGVKAELRRFVGRYPDQVLPPDLRPFAAPTATPAEPEE